MPFRALIPFALLSLAFAAPYPKIGPQHQLDFAEVLQSLPKTQVIVHQGMEPEATEFPVVSPPVFITETPVPFETMEPTETPDPFSEGPTPSMEPPFFETEQPSPDDFDFESPTPFECEGPDCTEEPTESMPPFGAGMTGDICETDMDCMPPRTCFSASGSCPKGALCRCTPPEVITCLGSEMCPEGEVCATNGSFEAMCVSEDYVDEEEGMFEIGRETL